jgi:hypothetical protein
MGSVDANFKSPIFRYDQPLVIAMNRASASLIGVRLRYQADGYLPGTILARNTTDGWYQAYDSGGASGTDTAACVLFLGRKAEDFDAASTSGSTTAVGIFGGCAVYKNQLTGYDSSVLTDLKGRLVIAGTGDELMLF